MTEKAEESLVTATEKSTARTESPASGPRAVAMTINYHGEVVELTEAEVFDFSVVLGIARRSREAAGIARECREIVERARSVWVRLGVWSR